MNKNNELVSVIMSVYNAENTIANSIESILSQTYKNIEILIMDDASTDGTLDILEKYALENTNLKIFKNLSNLGLTKSLNKLIYFSNGEYIARQDADDISFKKRLEIQIIFLKKNNLDAVATQALDASSGLKVHRRTGFLPVRVLMKFKNPFIHGTLLIKKSTLEEIGNYDERFYYSQDFKLMKDLYDKKFKIKIIKDVLYKLNTQNNISTNFQEKQKYFFDCARKGLIP